MPLFVTNRAGKRAIKGSRVTPSLFLPPIVCHSTDRQKQTSDSTRDQTPIQDRLDSAPSTIGSSHLSIHLYYTSHGGIRCDECSVPLRQQSRGNSVMTEYNHVGYLASCPFGISQILLTISRPTRLRPRMSVCMYVCMYVCMSGSMDAWMYMYIYNYICARLVLFAL